MSPAPDDAFVFNIVWNGTVFTYLRYFVASQIAQSDARFRFIVNACPPEQIALMEQFAAKYPDQIVELFEASAGRMVGHGDALDTVSRRPRRRDLLLLHRPRHPGAGSVRCRVRTAARRIVRGDHLRPRRVVRDGRHPGRPSGRVRRVLLRAGRLPLREPPLRDVRARTAATRRFERWDIGFGSGGPELSDEVKAALEACGQKYWVYDTGKIVNILFQEDGNRLCHIEHPQLMHIGGMSHYLSPPKWGKWVVLDDGEEPEPEWAVWPGHGVTVRGRAVHRQWCCATSAKASPHPSCPTGLEASMEERLVLVRDEIVQLVAKYEAAVLD